MLRKAVDSALAQTHRDFELVVADDGSTDGTRDYLEAIEDPRVHPIRLEHRGDHTSARSAGLRHARGARVAFLDSDDLWLPEKLALQRQPLALAGRYPDTSLNSCWDSRLFLQSRRSSCSGP